MLKKFLFIITCAIMAMYVTYGRSTMSQTDHLKNFIEKAFYDSFNSVGVSAKETAETYFTHDLKFYAGATEKILGFQDMIGRINTIREKMKQVKIIVTDVNISHEDPNYVSGTHYVIAEDLKGNIIIYKTTNIYRLKQGKIDSIRGVESLISDPTGKGASYRYSH